MREGGVGCFLGLRVEVRIPCRASARETPRYLACYCRRPVNSAPNIFVLQSTMGVEGCTKFIKYTLFFFNFIFWVSSLVFTHCVLTSVRSAASSLSLAVLVCFDCQPVMNERCWINTSHRFSAFNVIPPE